MRRWLVIFFAVLLPLQFGWSAASAYCGHETSAPQNVHFGHHLHAHKEAAKTSPASKLAAGADADCAWCHAGAPATASHIESRVFASATPSMAPEPSPPFTSVLARAPDRPQWLRLV